MCIFIVSEAFCRAPEMQRDFSMHLLTKTYRNNNIIQIFIYHTPFNEQKWSVLPPPLQAGICGEVFGNFPFVFGSLSLSKVIMEAGPFFYSQNGKCERAHKKI